MKRPAVFFDRDNTLIVSDGYLGDPDRVVLIEGAAEAVARVRSLGFAAVVFSNQSGVARGLFGEDAVYAVNHRLDELLHEDNPAATIDRHEFCPFHPDAPVEKYRQDSDLRKPHPGMIHQAARTLDLDLSRSWVVGDAPRDIEAGHAAGLGTVLLKIPGLPPSVALSERLRTEPTFVATSLREAVDFIERNLAAPEAPPDESAEEAAAGEGPAAQELPEEPEAHSMQTPAEAPAAVPAEAFIEARAEPAAEPPHSADGPDEPPAAQAAVVEPAADEWDELMEVAPPAERTAEAVEPQTEQENPGLTPLGAADAARAAAAAEPELQTEPPTEHQIEPRGESRSEPPAGVSAADSPAGQEPEAEAAVAVAVAEVEAAPQAARMPEAEPEPSPYVEPGPVESHETSHEVETMAADTRDPAEDEPECSPAEVQPDVHETHSPAEVVARATDAEVATRVVKPAMTWGERMRLAKAQGMLTPRPAAATESDDAAPASVPQAAVAGLSAEAEVIATPPGDAPPAIAPLAAAVPAEPEDAAPAGARPETTTESAAEVAEPAAGPAQPAAALPATTPPERAVPRRVESVAGTEAGGRDVARLEELAGQILHELRRMNEQQEVSDFSVSKVIAGIAQMAVALPLIYTYQKWDTPDAVKYLLVTVVLEAFTIAMLIMARQR